MPVVSRQAMSRWAVTGALGALGALVVHQVAYLLAFPASSARADALGDHHSHLPAQWSLVAPAATLAAGAFVVHQVRRLVENRTRAAGGMAAPVPRLGAGRLSAVTAALFVAQESFEAYVLHRGGPHPWANDAVLVGLVLAPLVALAIDHLLGGAAGMVVRWLGGRTPAGPARPGRQSWPGVTAPVVLVVNRPSSRGPPRRW